MQHREIKGDAIYSSNHSSDKQDLAIARHRIGRRCLAAASHHAADDSAWYALRVMPGRELTVENTLRGHGVECLVPMRKGKESWRRGRMMLPIIPVMIGYVLVRFEPSIDAFVGVCGIDHVQGVVGGTAVPRAISHCEVTRFEHRARNGDFDWARVNAGIKRNMHVVVMRGPFKGAKGIVVSARGDGLGDAVVEFHKDEQLPPALLPLAILNKL